MKGPTTLKQWLGSIACLPVTSSWVISSSLGENGLRLLHSLIHGIPLLHVTNLRVSFKLCVHFTVVHAIPSCDKMWLSVSFPFYIYMYL